MVTKENMKREIESGKMTPEDLVVEIFKAYETHPTQPLWLRETERWYELAACIFNTIAKPEMDPKTIQKLIETLEWAHLLEIDILGDLDLIDGGEEFTHPTLVTIETLCQRAGFNEEESRKAVGALCEAAAGFKNHYQGKVQYYLREIGMRMLAELGKIFAFQHLEREEVRQTFSFWFQNALNLPIPVEDPISEDAAAKLGIDYDSLVDAADAVDLNVALLDDAMRLYGENMIVFGTAEEI